MIELDAEQVLHVRPFLSVTVGIIVLFVGKVLNQRLAALREYSIPEPVTGGLLFSAAFGAVYVLSGVKVDFELTARDILLVYFFTVIGINAHVSDLVRGGKLLAALLAVTVAFMFVGNFAGMGAALLLGLDPSIGLLAASISMVGGHGTAIAWAPVISEARGVPNAMDIGVVCATMGLVLASIAGGPVARFLIQRYRLAARPIVCLTLASALGPSIPGSTTSPSCARSSLSTSRRLSVCSSTGGLRARALSCHCFSHAWPPGSY
jgi:glutamate:Na+ symporter, ESS family